MPSLSTGAVTLLCRLVDDGPIRENVTVDPLTWAELVRLGLADVVLGRERSCLVASFAGKRLRIQFRNDARYLLTRDDQR